MGQFDRMLFYIVLFTWRCKCITIHHPNYFILRSELLCKVCNTSFRGRCSHEIRPACIGWSTIRLVQARMVMVCFVLCSRLWARQAKKMTLAEPSCQTSVKSNLLHHADIEPHHLFAGLATIFFRQKSNFTRLIDRKSVV